MARCSGGRLTSPATPGPHPAGNRLAARRCSYDPAAFTAGYPAVSAGGPEVELLRRSSSASSGGGSGVVRSGALELALALREKRRQFADTRSSVGGESTASQCSASSLEEILEIRRENPEEILENLGFISCGDHGGVSRVPQRFLDYQTAAEGIHVHDYIKRQEEMVTFLDSGFSGYRGLSGQFTLQSESLAHSLGLFAGTTSADCSATSPTAATSAQRYHMALATPEQSRRWTSSGRRKRKAPPPALTSETRHTNETTEKLSNEDSENQATPDVTATFGAESASVGVRLDRGLASADTAPETSAVRSTLECQQAETLESQVEPAFVTTPGSNGAAAILHNGAAVAQNLPPSEEAQPMVTRNKTVTDGSKSAMPAFLSFFRRKQQAKCEKPSSSPPTSMTSTRNSPQERTNQLQQSSMQDRPLVTLV